MEESWPVRRLILKGGGRPELHLTISQRPPSLPTSALRLIASLTSVRWLRRAAIYRLVVAPPPPHFGGGKDLSILSVVRIDQRLMRQL